jgi:protein-tyrosine phosphatase
MHHRWRPRTGTVSCLGIEPVRVLVICTANICRSVMTEAFLARALSSAGVPAEVSSAGVNALVGSNPPGEVVQVMREHGIDVAAHRGRQLAEPMVAAADLVIGLTLEHLREAVVMDPRLLGCGFTLKELARRAAGAGPRPADVGVAAWLATLTGGREIEDLLGGSSEDDFPDPIGMPVGAYRQAGADASELVTVLVRELWPAGRGIDTSLRAPGPGRSRGIV